MRALVRASGYGSSSWLSPLLPLGTDRVSHLPAGTGSLAAAVETASGRQALVVGKPSPYMFECITEHFSVDPARTLMVGDRLETDILFGHRCGMTTLLTLTGVSRLEEAQAYLASGQHDLVPHYYVESIADLMEGLED
nr:pyridoxal phosphate phosphatase [Vulpes vulpes]